MNEDRNREHCLTKNFILLLVLLGELNEVGGHGGRMKEQRNSHRTFVRNRTETSPLVTSGRITLKLILKKQIMLIM
jgi:hypothetical protein